MSGDVVIDARYCGPSESGNGGYVCGVFADRVGTDCEITLRKPPPLDQPMRIASDDNAWQLMHGEVLVPEARTVDPIAVDLIAAPSLDEARRASEGYIGFTKHPFPRCYVCGPERSDDDGFHIFAGPLGRDDAVASAWTPRPETVGSEASVPLEFVWAALDCPGGLSVIDDQFSAVVLGRFAARQIAPLNVGQTYAAAGWKVAQDGCKYSTASALFDSDGDAKAIARATWIAL